MKRFILVFSCFCFLGFPFELYGQDITVSGTVISKDDGEALPGVNIVVEGSRIGTVTNLQGEYSLEVPENSTLVFSSVGFQTQSVKINGRSVINVEMLTNVKQLEELVVVGYGTMKKEDVIGSVASVNNEDLKKVPSVSFDQALQGMATGLHVKSDGGTPGSNATIKIRGINSINANTDPLWIIDGMPIYSGSGFERNTGTTRLNPMSLINPNDIASIEVLKDAAATAIYGSRGSSGVIIITTKSGKKGSDDISVDYSTGISNLVKTPEDIGLVNTREYFQLLDEAKRNTSGNPNAAFSPSEVLSTRVTLDDMSRDQALNVQTDWFNEAMRTGSYHDVNLSTNIGMEKGGLYLSGNYRQDQGVDRNNDLKRITGRINLNLKPLENLITEARLGVTYSKFDRIKSSSSGAVGTGGGRVGGFGVLNRTALPWFPIFDSNNETGYWSPASGANIRANLDEDLILDEVEKFRGIGGIAVEYSLPWIKGLSIRSEGSFDIIQNNSIEWVEKNMREDMTSFAGDKAVTYQGYNYNLYARYVQSFDDHDLNRISGNI